jgi:hypothetical protein
VAVLEKKRDRTLGVNTFKKIMLNILSSKFGMLIKAYYFSFELHFNNPAYED